MPFGLSGAPSSFQRLMDEVCRGLPFVTTYLDDVLVHSTTKDEHEQHLQEVFKGLLEAGLTLQGWKYRIGMSQVTYLGHVFSARGMEPDPQKVSAVQGWNTPTDASSLRSFLGLASYYHRYIHQFADIAAPLHHITSKGYLPLGHVLPSNLRKIEVGAHQSTYFVLSRLLSNSSSIPPPNRC